MKDVTIIFFSLYILIMEWRHYNTRKYSKSFEELAYRAVEGWTESVENNKKLVQRIGELMK